MKRKIPALLFRKSADTKCFIALPGDAQPDIQLCHESLQHIPGYPGKQSALGRLHVVLRKPKCPALRVKLYRGYLFWRHTAPDTRYEGHFGSAKLDIWLNKTFGYTTGTKVMMWLYITREIQ